MFCISSTVSLSLKILPCIALCYQQADVEILFHSEHQNHLKSGISRPKSNLNVTQRYAPCEKDPLDSGIFSDQFRMNFYVKFNFVVNIGCCKRSSLRKVTICETICEFFSNLLPHLLFPKLVPQDTRSLL